MSGDFVYAALILSAVYGAPDMEPRDRKRQSWVWLGLAAVFMVLGWIPR